MKNGKPVSLEERLKTLEADVKEIKAMLQARPAGNNDPKKSWWEEMIGVFANDPVADEVRKIVEENRERVFGHEGGRYRPLFWDSAGRF